MTLTTKNLTETKISILNKDNEKLVGIKSTPFNKRKKYPTVILVHGFGVTKEESGMFDALAKNLCESGFIVFRFDFSGCGESEGDYSETSLSKLKSDLNEIIKFVKTQPKVDISRIGILGQSFGTATTITLGPKVESFIMMSSVSRPEESLSKLFGKGYDSNGISSRLGSSGKITKIRPQFWKDFNNHNLLKSIKKISSPILFIHGENDKLVPISEMEAYFENANEPKEKIVINGANHQMKPHINKMCKIVVDWFKKTL